MGTGQLSCLGRIAHQPGPAKREYMMFGVGWSTNSALCIFTHLFLKEVCVGLEGNHIHPWEGVNGIVNLKIVGCFRQLTWLSS
jgi:hypothetical protein